MEITGYIAALFIGFTLGLLGGGGSILTIPVLVYLFSIFPTMAISYSLFIVGFTSLIGAYNNYRRGLVNVETAIIFGASSVTTVFITRKFIIPLVPEVFFKVGSFRVTHSMFVMVVFSLLMLTASISMISSHTINPLSYSTIKRKPIVLIMYGILIGLVTGFLGAGGGFLLIPALVILMKLPMKEAIGTSLLIISLNCLMGFVGDIGRHFIDWRFLLTFTCIAIAGIFMGGRVGQKIKAEKLKKAFGWFVLMMGIYMLVEELFL